MWGTHSVAAALPITVCQQPLLWPAHTLTLPNSGWQPMSGAQTYNFHMPGGWGKIIRLLHVGTISPPLETAWRKLEILKNKRIWRMSLLPLTKPPHIPQIFNEIFDSGGNDNAA